MKTKRWGAAAACVTALSLALGLTAPTASAAKTSDPITYVQDYVGRVYDAYNKRIVENGKSPLLLPEAPSITVSELRDQQKEQTKADEPDGGITAPEREDSSVPVSEGPSSVDSKFASIADPDSMGDYWDNLDSLRIEQHKGLNPVIDENGKKAKEKSDNGYDRDDQFPHWETIGTEPTANDWPEEIPKSCDARRATLIRDGVDLKVKAKGCKIIVGDSEDAGWTDSYGVPKKKGDAVATDESGNVIIKDYKHSNKPRGFDIDHIVALGDVWETGAKDWGDDKDAETLRQQIANDPLNLTISDSSANRSKSAQTPAAYIPPGRFKCEYIKRYAAVKAKYDLSISEQDSDVLTRLGEYCKL